MNMKEDVDFTLNMPIQFIVTSQLSEKENFWLKNLTNNLQDERMAKKLIEFYKEHEDDIHYKSVMDVIMRANKKLFQKGDKDMCDAMMEILQEQIDAMLEKASEKSKADGIRIGEERGFHLAKRVMQLNAIGENYESIAAKCKLTVEEVRELLAF